VQLVGRDFEVDDLKVEGALHLIAVQRAMLAACAGLVPVGFDGLAAVAGNIVLQLFIMTGVTGACEKQHANDVHGQPHVAAED